MALHIRPDSLAHLENKGNVILLGIITLSDEVVLTEGDPVIRPGHLAWLRVEKRSDAIWGFSILLKGGEIAGLFSGSELNRTANRELPALLAAEIEQLLRNKLGPRYQRW